MLTLQLRADPASPECPDLTIAAGILRSGGTVAFATETVYGLGANALDAAAVEKVFIAKQRPSWDPLIVHIADASMLPLVSSTMPAAARALVRRFWPGPLTLLLPRSQLIPYSVTAGRTKVGIRMPAHPVACALIRAAGVPIAAPSANTFGHVSPTTAAHVSADLNGRIDAILDSGETLHGLESTVLDAGEERCVVYRPGAVTLEQLREVWPSVEMHSEAQKQGASARNASRDQSSELSESQQHLSALPSPGLGIRHYAPRARLVLVESEGGGVAQALSIALDEARARWARVGLMCPDGIKLSEHDGAAPGTTSTYKWGEWNDPSMLAHRLYAGLRALDEAGVEVIVCPIPPVDGLGAAIIDRLLKAARLQ